MQLHTYIYSEVRRPAKTHTHTHIVWIEGRNLILYSRKAFIPLPEGLEEGGWELSNDVRAGVCFCWSSTRTEAAADSRRAIEAEAEAVVGVTLCKVAAIANGMKMPSVITVYWHIQQSRIHIQLRHSLSLIVVDCCLDVCPVMVYRRELKMAIFFLIFRNLCDTFKFNWYFKLN